MAWRRYTTKYGNKKTYAYGIEFDSKKEASRYVELKLMQDQGIIKNLELQKKYVLIPAQYEPSTETYTKGKHKGEPKHGKLIERECAYVADFDYIDENGRHVVEDTKGMVTKDYILKRKMLLYFYGIRIREV